MNKKIKRVIFIVADTLRAQEIGFNQKGKSITPFIDFFGKKSVNFKSAYTTITCTDPAITSMMSGCFPLCSGLINHGPRVTDAERSQINKLKLLPEILSENGFKTLAVDWLGRWHKRGYDYYSGKISNNYRGKFPIYLNLPFPFITRIFDNLLLKLANRSFFSSVYYDLFANPKIPYDNGEVIVSKAKELIIQNKSVKSFLYLHFWDTHAPYTHSRGIGSFLKKSATHKYRDEIAYFDLQFKKLFEWLQQMDLLKNTMIVFTADHGENFNDHDLPLHHENLYNDVVRVPLMIYHPEIKNKKIDQPVQHIDLLPTILDFLGIDFKRLNLNGRSLLPLINGKSVTSNRDIFFEDITYTKLSFLPVYRRQGIIHQGVKYIRTYKAKSKVVERYQLPTQLETSAEEIFKLNGDKEMKLQDSPRTKNLVNKLTVKLDQQVYKLHLLRIARSNPQLFKKLKKSINIIQRASGIPGLAIAWKGGKDTTVMMHIMKNILGKIPNKVFFNDTTLEFKETYLFIQKITRLWDLDLLILPHTPADMAEFHAQKNESKKAELARMMKIKAIKTGIKKFKFKGYILGIRRDENPARLNEKFFSKRDDHIRVHPLLDWSENDIWVYINEFGVPYNSLYNKGYRSVGEKPFTRKSTQNERSGRDSEKEKVMGQLRNLGYW